MHEPATDAILCCLIPPLYRHSFQSEQQKQMPLWSATGTSTTRYSTLSLEYRYRYLVTSAQTRLMIVPFLLRTLVPELESNTDEVQTDYLHRHFGYLYRTELLKWKTIVTETISSKPTRKVKHAHGKD